MYCNLPTQNSFYDSKFVDQGRKKHLAGVGL